MADENDGSGAHEPVALDTNNNSNNSSNNNDNNDNNSTSTSSNGHGNGVHSSSAAPTSDAGGGEDSTTASASATVMAATNGPPAATTSAVVSAPSTATATPAAAAAAVTVTSAPTSSKNMPPKSRKFNMGHSARRLRTEAGDSTNGGASGESTAPNQGHAQPPAAATNGIVVGLRRRHGARPASATGAGPATAVASSSGSVRLTDKVGSSDDENDSTAAAERRRALSRTNPKKAPGRSQSLKRMASLIRSNMRNGRQPGDEVPEASGVPKRENQKGFAGIAHQVVSTQRAARGFMAMWGSSSGGAVYIYQGIHMEKKKLDVTAVASEFKETRRRQFYQELVVHLVFLLLFFSLLSWLPVQDSFQQNDVVGTLTCRQEGVCELNKLDDVYEFVATVHNNVCERKDVSAQWIRLGGVRFRQVRVKEEICGVYNGWMAPCYPFFSVESELRDAINGSVKEDSSLRRVYEWHDGLGTLRPQLSSSLLDTLSLWDTEQYGDGGYVVDLCGDATVAELQEDEWLSVATRAFSVEFTLVNPVTRVFTIGWHVFTVNPSGHMRHYPHSANLRVIGLEEVDIFDSLAAASTSVTMTDDHSQAFRTNRDGTGKQQPVFHIVMEAARRVYAVVQAIDHRVVLWITLVMFFLTYCIGEASVMTTMGAGTYLKSDMWNVFELTHLIVLAMVLIEAALYYVASSRFSGHLVGVLRGQAANEIDHSDVQELLFSFQRLSDRASLACGISVLKVFKFLRMNSTLNLLWRVLGMALRDLMGFLVIFQLIFLGYSAMGTYAFGFALEEFSTIAKSFSTCFLMLAGEVDYPRLQHANPRLAPLFIVTFIVLVFQILVNMFVAILSEYYESAKNDVGGAEDVEYDVLARVRTYWKACSPTVVAKKNEVIRLLAKQQVRLISTNLVDQEETRQRARKLFRGAVWRVVALLRFGVKFDRRIRFRDRPKDQPSPTRAADGLVSHICLSENFDHKTIKEMIPIGITVHLQGDSLLGYGLALKVLRHSKLSVECVVLGHVDSAGHIETGDTEPRSAFFSPPTSPRSGAESNMGSDSDGDPFSAPRREQVLELLGGEKLRIPFQIFVLHLIKTLLKELQASVMRATKLWSYSKTHLVDDYHLALLFNSMIAEGRTSLRFDEVYRMLDLYLRKDSKKRLCTQAEVRQEALQVMFRFRKCLIDMPSREKEGHNYRPKPVDTRSIDLGQLEHLADMLAQNCHDMWALERLKQGWQYGAERNDANKRHPNLVPYLLLSWDEQQYDYRSSMETLKTIVFMNFSIVRASATSGSFQGSFSRSSSNISDGGESSTGSNNGLPAIEEGDSARRDSFGTEVGKTSDSAVDDAVNLTSKGPSKKKVVPSLLREAMSFRRNSLIEDSPYTTMYGENLNLEYRPLPIDTSKVDVPSNLLRLVDLLAENAHEVWAKGRMDEGWTYGPQRSDDSKKHPCLVPYIFLTDDEKAYDINIAKETLKTLLAMKFIVVDRTTRT